MAKNSIDAYGASGKSNQLFFEPGALTIIEDPSHPLYDERITLPLDEAMVRNIMKYGVREPVLIWKDPETAKVLVVDGRQRVRHAAEACRRLVDAGEPPIQVPAIPQRGQVGTMSELMISMNELRRDDSPLVKARKMAAFQARGYSDEMMAQIFGCSAATVAATLSLLDSPQAVQSAVEAGQISLTHAKALSKLTPDEQRAKVEELIEAGAGVRPHERARRQAKILGGPHPGRRKPEIREALKTATGDVARALRWVLGDVENLPEVILTAGLDLQADRVECELMDWERNEENWVDAKPTMTELDTAAQASE